MIVKCKLDEANNYLSERYDLFLCHASFESRCLSMARNIDREKIDKALIFFMEDYSSYVDENRLILESLWGNKAKAIKLIHADPIYSADKMIEALKTQQELAPIESILVDITTFTHESLLMLIKLLSIEFLTSKITYIYANAKEYDANNNKNEKWLSKGVGDIRSVLGYPGEFLPAQKTHLILIVGYEVERATKIINTIEPSSLSLGYGRSGNATTDKDQEANEHYCQLIEEMASSFSSISRFEVKCDDPFFTCQKIEEEINSHNEMNVVIVPLNNKITTMGVSFAVQNNPNVQVCYAPALIYNYSDYSRPGESCYIIQKN